MDELIAKLRKLYDEGYKIGFMNTGDWHKLTATIEPDSEPSLSCFGMQIVVSEIVPPDTVYALRTHRLPFAWEESRRRNG